MNVIHRKSIQDGIQRVSNTSIFTGEEKMILEITERIPGMIAVYSIVTGKYIYVNTAIKNLLGYTPSDFINGGIQFVTSLVHPDDLQPIMQKNQRALETANKNNNNNNTTSTEPIINFEYRIKHKDGTWRWLHTDGSVLRRSKDGAVEYVLNISLDITHRKMMEESIKDLSNNLMNQVKERTSELSLQEKKSQLIIQNSSDVISIIDKNGVILYQSPSLKTMLGYSPKELIGKNIINSSIVHPKDLELYKNFIKNLQKNSRDCKTVIRLRHKKGHYLHIELIGKNLTANPIIRGIITSYRDITAQKRTLNDLQNLKYALDQSAIVAITDKGGKIEYVNDQFIKISKYTKKELVGKTHRIINSKYHEKEFMHNLWDIILSGKIWRGEIRNRTRHGKYYWVDTTITPLLNENGKPEKFIAIRYDITKRKELERQKDEFIGVASHELKTPVTSLKAYVQVMHKRFMEKNDLASAKYMGKMLNQINKLSTLIQDLLDITKIETGKLQFHEEYSNINELATEVIEVMQLTTDKHLIIKRGEVHKKVYADSERIGQVITNFISNAIKYSPDSERIIVKLFSNSKEARICVQDFGVGIQKEKQAKIFERFYRVTGAKEDTFPGLGLGLYISTEIIRRHNGKIWVKSKEAKGSTFCFSLPFSRKNIRN